MTRVEQRTKVPEGVHPRVTPEVFDALQELWRTEHIDEEGAENVLFHGHSINHEQCRTGERRYALKTFQKMADMLAELEETFTRILHVHSGQMEGDVADLAAHGMKVLARPIGRRPKHVEGN